MFNGHIPKIKRTYIVNKVGSLKTTGSLTDSSTGAVSLTDGQVAILNISSNASDTGVKIPLNEFVDGTSASAYVPQMKLVQGTSASSNPPADNRPGVKRPYESSANVESDGEMLIVVKAARAASYSVWGLGNINVEDLTEYSTRIAFRSEYHDVFASDSYASVPVYPVSYTSPDYTQLISDAVLASTAESLDHLIKNIVVQTNKNSAGLGPNTPLTIGNELVLALAVKGVDLASGTFTIDAVSATVTSVTIAGVTLSDGVEYAVVGGDEVATASAIVDAILANLTLAASGVSATSAFGVVTVTTPGIAGNSVTTTAIGADIIADQPTLAGGVGTSMVSMVAGVPLVIETINGAGGSVINKSYSFNKEEILSLRFAYPSGSIIVADISTATGTPSSPVSYATVLAFVGLDRELFAAEDRSKGTKTRLEVGLTSGYNTSLVLSSQVSAPKEGGGYVRTLQIGYEETQGRRDGDIQYRGQGMTKISYPSDVLAITAPQDQVIITHSQSKHSGLAKRNINLHETVVLTAATVDADDVPVNTPAALAVGAPTLGANTAAVATAVEAWARRNGVKVQVRYDI